MITYVLVGVVCFLAGIFALWAYDRVAYSRAVKFQTEATYDAGMDYSEEWEADSAWDADEQWDDPEIS